MTREELIREVWQDNAVEENNLTVRMSALRKALGESADNRFIETVPARGYRFVGRLRQLFSEHGESHEAMSASLAVLPLIAMRTTCPGLITFARVLQRASSLHSLT